MKEEDLIRRFPRLWHMAEDGSWPSIQAHGLLSTLALLDLYGVRGARRAEIMTARRPKSIALAAAGLPGAVIRDQKPMNDGALSKCLRDGLSPGDWYAILNAKTFFWLDHDRLMTLLGARAYRASPHLVIEVDTASLLDAHRGSAMLCPINSGATFYIPSPRGLSTFQKVADYHYDPGAKGAAKGRPPVEFVIEHSVPDVVDHARRVDRHDGGTVEAVWP